MYDIVFLSRLIPAEIEHEVNQKSVNLMEGAAIAWQRHIVQGIEENNKRLLKLINSLPVHAYPGGYSDAFIRESKSLYRLDELKASGMRYWRL